MHEPGVFQHTLLRAFQLPQSCREVFLLRQIQGYTLLETAAILGISVEAAWDRLQRARREINRFEHADRLERAT
jgi:DNA-directed RNA polymerase specialized sigma24 family protein